MSDTAAATFGEQLRAWRQAAGLTQKELADACGIDFTYVSKIEREKSAPPSVETLHALADACGVDRIAMCRAAKRFPKPITMADLERLWWLQRDMLDDNNVAELATNMEPVKALRLLLEVCGDDTHAMIRKHQCPQLLVALDALTADATEGERS